MLCCNACGHPGVHAQVILEGAGVGSRCPDCPVCRRKPEPDRPSENG